MRLRNTLLACLAAALLPAAAQARDGSTTVDPTFAIGSSGWTGATSAKFYLAWDLALVDGRPMVCGTWSVSDLRFRPAVRNMLRQGAILADGQPLVENLTFFRRARGRVRDEEQMIGQTADCAAIRANIPADADIRLSLGSGRARF